MASFANFTTCLGNHLQKLTTVFNNSQESETQLTFLVNIKIISKPLLLDFHTKHLKIYKSASFDNASMMQNIIFILHWEGAAAPLNTPLAGTMGSMGIQQW